MDADVLIIGSGPAGLQAAIHSARRKVSTVLIGRISGSAAYGISVENYFGTAGKAKGIDLLMNGVRQAHSFGCEVLDMNVVSASRGEDGTFKIVAESGTEIEARAVVLATGISRNKLNVPGEAEFSNGKGVSYCVTCDKYPSKDYGHLVQFHVDVCTKTCELTARPYWCFKAGNNGNVCWNMGAYYYVDAVTGEVHITMSANGA